MPEPTPDAWAQIRYAYEHTDRPIEDICIEHGISSGTLRDRVRRWRWTRRRPPIPREGPPPVAMAPREIAERGWPGEAALPNPEYPENPPHPMSSQGSDIDLSPHAGRGEDAEADAATIVPRLQSAVARVLPAIEATIARLAAGPHHPREMEQAGRALSALTRTLRELNALLSQQDALLQPDDDPVPKDMDEFRNELARRIRAFIEARKNKQGAQPDQAGGPEGQNGYLPAAAVDGPARA